MDIGSLINLLEDQSLDDPHHIISAIKNHFWLKHVTYVCANLPEQIGKTKFISATTYPACWQNHYLESNYLNDDPAVKLAMQSLLPIDWTSIEKKSSISRKIFGEAKEFGIAETGLSLTVRGLLGETGLITINSDFSSQTWADYKIRNIAEIQMVSSYLHHRMLEINNFKLEIPRLSKREIEAIYWASRGKTYAESAKIMGISENTIKLYFTTARAKLCCLTTAQCVAKALSLRIISPLA